jgi:hypothetical protein
LPLILGDWVVPSPLTKWKRNKAKGVHGDGRPLLLHDRVDCRLRRAFHSRAWCYLMIIDKLNY